IRFIIVPSIIVVPGIISFKLYGDINDAAYGTLVGDVLPDWLSGVFAAALAAAVLTTYNSNLNSATALYVCDIHEAYVNKKPEVAKLGGIVTAILTVVSLVMVPIYAQAESIINLLQQLYGLLSMPILSIFIVGLLFNNVNPYAGITAVIFGVLLYSFFSFVHAPFGLHYIHLMLVTLICCIGVALGVNKLVFRQSAQWRGRLVDAD
ncbi:MAG: SLC5 family protein, partial [Alteromonas sp.]